MLYVPAWTDEPQFTSVDIITHTSEVTKEQSYSSDLFHSLILAVLVLSEHKHTICFGLTWLVVVDVSKEEEDDAEGGESCPPGKQEHQHHGDHRSKQSCPFAVVVERWPPT